MKKIVAMLMVMLLVLSGCSQVQTGESTAQTPEASEEVKQEETTGSMGPQTFTGTGIGRNGEVKVDVEFDEDGRILSVVVAEQAETATIASVAMERIPQEIADNNTVKVDIVSGATLTSNAILTAVNDAVAQAGFDISNYQSEIPVEIQDYVMETDIVIVGAGGSGLTAAIEAAQKGAKVILVETNGYAGGATRFSGGMVMYAATPDEVDEFGSLDANTLSLGIKAYASEHFNDALNLDYLNHTLDNLNWLKAMYDGEDLVDTHDPGYVPLPGKDTVDHTLAITVCATPTDSGMAQSWVADSLQKAAVEAGATLLLNTTADEILTGEDGIVNGIHATDQKGNTYTISAKKVILASGGYGANLDMLLEHTDMTTPFYLGPTSNQGFGITGTEFLGAQVAHADLPDMEGAGQMVFGTVGGLIVNENAQVLNQEDAVIENLYAVGELTCVQVLDAYHFSAGENISWNLYSGRIAGAHAAAMLNQ